LGFYAASSVTSLPTYQDNLPVPSSRVKDQLPNKPEQRSYLLHVYHTSFLGANLIFRSCVIIRCCLHLWLRVGLHAAFPMTEDRDDWRQRFLSQ